MKETRSAWIGIALPAVVCAAFLGSPEAQAQTTAAEAELLEEIVVRAQRRETNLARTALAASVLSGDDLVDRGVVDLPTLQYAVPSVNISNYGSANVFNIRGIGRSKVDIEVPSGVVIYADGVPTLAGYFQNEPYFDMESVEVLRGPQGTVAGKSASGGAVFMNTRSPRIGESGGSVEIGGGDFSRFEARGAINMPVSDTVAFRAAANYETRDHYYDRITGPYTGRPGERDLKSLRLGMLVVPSDKLQVLAKVSLADLDFGGNVTSSFGDPIFDVPQDAPFEYRDESTRIVLDIDYTTDGGVRFSSLTGYQELDTVNNLDVNGSADPTYWFESAGNIELTSQEFNLVSPDDQALRWVFGAFWQNQKSELPPIDQKGFVFTGGPFFPNLDYPWLGSPWVKDEDDWALFAHLVFDLADGLELEFGARYSDYEMMQTTEYLFGFGDAPPSIPFFPPAGQHTQQLAEDSVDWKIGLNWTVNDTNFLYGVISRGHTTGSVNIFPPYDPYDEMEVRNIDLGWKAEFNEGRVRTQLAAYYEDIEGYQAAFTDLDIPNSAGQVQNADSDSSIYGVEFTAEASFDTVSVDLGVSFNESELGDFDNVAHPLTLAIVDLTGAKFPFAPDFSANLGLEFRKGLSGKGQLTTRFDVSHIGKTYGELFDDPEFLLEARTLLNFQLRFDRDDWHATLWVTNAADERYVGAIQNTGSLYYAAPPRQWGVRVGKDF